MIELKECIDNNKPYQSKGDKAIYYLRFGNNCNVKTTRFDADCIKKRLNIIHSICDSFFRIEGFNENKKIVKWILVETKGNINNTDPFLQLEKSLDLMDNYRDSKHGRIVGTKVPSILTRELKTKFDNLQLKFIKVNGTLHFSNKLMYENFLSINNTLIYKTTEKSKPLEVKL